MLPQNKPDRIRILFDDHRLVANAGLLLPATLARHLGLRELVDHHLDLGGRRDGRTLGTRCPRLCGGETARWRNPRRTWVENLTTLGPTSPPDARRLRFSGRRRCRRDDLHPVPDQAGRRAGAAHCPAGEAVRLALFAKSRLHHAGCPAGQPAGRITRSARRFPPLSPGPTLLPGSPPYALRPPVHPLEGCPGRLGPGVPPDHLGRLPPTLAHGGLGGCSGAAHHPGQPNPPAVAGEDVTPSKPRGSAPPP